MAWGRAMAAGAQARGRAGAAGGAARARAWRPRGGVAGSLPGGAGGKPRGGRRGPGGARAEPVGGAADTAAAGVAAAVTDGGGEGVQVVISALFTLAIVMLGGITVGVGYLSYKSWADNRAEKKEAENAEKERRFAAMAGQDEESSAPRGPGGKKGMVADSYLGKARGFGKALENDNAPGQ